MSVKLKTYRLYAAVANPETIETAMNTPYARICGGYALVYKTGKRPNGYSPVDDTGYNLLPEEDRKWIEEVNWAILAEFADKHKESVKKGVRVFAERFDAALKTQREEMEAEKNGY